MKEYFQFKHPNDITIGKGRVVYEAGNQPFLLRKYQDLVF